MGNIIISETYVDVTRKQVIRKRGFYQTPTDNKKELFVRLQKEYGQCRGKIYSDASFYGKLPVGWIFQKKSKYDDTGEPFVQQTWVEMFNQLACP